MLLSMTVAPSTPPSTPLLKRSTIPGSHGWPVIGPMSDKLQYFWFQGPESFFKTRIERYNSTVFRTNVPPAFPFFTGVDPRVVAVLDVNSFMHLFDMEFVEKANVLVGDFMPSVGFTGGIRVCAYLDSSETKHSQVKSFAQDILKRSSTKWLSSMISNLDVMFDSMDTNLAAGQNAAYLTSIQQFLFTFLSDTLLGANTSASPEIQQSGYFMINKWLALQLMPIIPINILQPLEEIFLHSFRFPFWLVKSDYEKLSNWVRTEAVTTLQRAQSDFNLTEEEAIHNLLFILGFNAYGGFSIFLPSLISNLSDKKVQNELKKEVRDTLSNKELSFQSVNQMELVNSFVYETLRMNPPVPMQFGRARKSFDLRSHDNVFEIEKGELLCGYQPLVMRDPKVFLNPEEFVYNRFSKAKEGDELLKYLYWSNGPQNGIEGPSVSNKQCPGRDIVPITAALFLAYLFQRYDEVEVSSGSFTTLKKAKH